MRRGPPLPNGATATFGGNPFEVTAGSIIGFATCFGCAGLRTGACVPNQSITDKGEGSETARLGEPKRRLMPIAMLKHDWHVADRREVFPLRFKELLRNQLNRLTGLDLIWGELRSEEWAQIRIGNQGHAADQQQ
jgi:hypothetical protein